MPKPFVFWELVVERDDCWEWTGPTLKGYGKSGRGLAHRVAFEQMVAEIPNRLQLDHLCRNTLCVNPAHLEPVTRDENMRRHSLSVTHCKHGHEFTRENTYMRPDRPGRQCRTCNRQRVAWRKKVLT